MPTGTIADPALAQQLLDALDALAGGVHAGFRPAHAKGLMCEGTFTPSSQAPGLTRAKHATAATTPVTVRFSDATGFPTIADNDPANSGPRGMAIRFHLGPHEHTDIVSHSIEGFPVRTGEEFLAFLRAAAEAGAGRPQAIGAFLASHPGAKRFVETPKPIPASFAREAYFALTAFKFTSAAGVSRFGRFCMRPEAGTAYLSAADAAKQSANFLFDEMDARLSGGPVRFGIFVQIADANADDVTDVTTAWPSDRPEVQFGTIALTTRVDHDAPERRKIIFDPHPRTDGIDESGDPLTAVRADIYLLSGRRRRAASGDVRH